MFAKLLITLFLLSAPAFAVDHNDIEGAKFNRYDITGLFVFRPVKYEYEGEDVSGRECEVVPEKFKSLVVDNENLVIILNVSSHAGFEASFDIFSIDGKYSIFVDRDEDLKADFRMDTYFGGAEQYAFYASTESQPILGKINETAEYNNMRVFAGRRADPEVFDTSAYKKVLETLCTPVDGLRCQNTGTPKNDYADSNVGTIAVQVPIKLLTGLPEPTIDMKKLKVWAKVYKIAK
jgi:hypothetical protein